MRIASIHVYPVKSLRGVSLPGAEVEPWGLAGDRRWLVVDATGRFLTQREVAQFATVRVEATSSGVRLSAAGRGEIEVAIPSASATRVEVTIFRASVSAVAAGDAVAAWLSDLAGEPCRLVYMDRPDRARPAAPRPGVEVGTVSFADEYPLLLTSSASLAALRADSGLEFPMERFRPNLVVDGAAPWTEDGWRRIAIGETVFDVVQTCGRCVITTIDQASGRRDPDGEPLRSLNLLRRRGPGAPPFGIHLTPRSSGRVEVGDGFAVLARS